MAGFRLTTKAKPPQAAQSTNQTPTQSAPSGSSQGPSTSRNTNAHVQKGEAIWQSMSPEMRLDALRATHLVNLFRQINPELRLCRRSTSDVSTQSQVTAEKGVQVPDIRFELAGARRVRNPSYIGPGVSILPRPAFNVCQSRALLPGGVRQPPPFPGGQFFANSQRFPWSNPPPKGALRGDTSVFRRSTPGQRSFGSQPAIRNIVTSEASSSKKSVVPQGDETSDNKVHNEAKQAKDPGEIDSKDSAIKSKARCQSSGDDDSVVVVLNEPKEELDLERRYGQFFCRRCFRAWSSRNLWCVQGSCKVYIKQTCNTCNRVVNPYLVCRLTPMLDYRQNRSSSQQVPEANKSESDRE